MCTGICICSVCILQIDFSFDWFHKKIIIQPSLHQPQAWKNFKNTWRRRVKFWVSPCGEKREREREREREARRRQSMKRVCACVAVSKSVFMCWPHMCQDLVTTVPRLMRMCDMFDSCVSWRILMCVTWLIHMWMRPVGYMHEFKKTPNKYMYPIFIF